MLEEARIYVGLRDKVTREQLFDTEQYKVVLKDICRGYGVAFSLQVIEGCYCHDDGTWVDENTLLITLIGAPKKTVYNIASDVCKRFHQESVMVTACNTVHFNVKDKEKEEKKEKKKPKKK